MEVLWYGGGVERRRVGGGKVGAWRGLLEGEEVVRYCGGLFTPSPWIEIEIGTLVDWTVYEGRGISLVVVAAEETCRCSEGNVSKKGRK